MTVLELARATASEKAVRLSPVVAGPRIVAKEAFRALLGLDRATGLRVDLQLDDVIVTVARHGAEASVTLRGLRPPPVGSEAGLLRVEARFEQVGEGARALVDGMRRALGEPIPQLASRVRRAVEAIVEMRKVMFLRDAEFRDISSSLEGDHGILRLGYRCNQDCHFCWQDREGASPAPERYFGWLDEMAALGVGHISFTGGEPTAYKDLLALIEKAASQHRMTVSIQTNAIAMASDAYTRRLVEAGLDVAMISYHSADSAVSDAMTRAPGTHVKTQEGIVNALSAGLRVLLTCVVERQNVERLPEHAQDIVTRFVEPFPDNPPRRVAYAHPTSYWEGGLWGRSQLPFDVIRPHLVGAARTLYEAGVQVQVTGTCGFPLCILAGEPDLVAHQVMQREVFDQAQLQHLRYGDRCADCARKQACMGLRPEYLEHFGDRGLSPFMKA